MGSHQVEEVDVLLVGAGFGSFMILNKVRKLGLSVKIYEKGAASGGIWYWNCYPGARVDSASPIYQIWEKDLWEDFNFKEKYPGGPELRRYFDHVEEKWHVKKDISFNKHVDSAEFDENRKQWLVECSDGSEIYCKWFIPCIGFASRRYTPPFKGLSTFKGDIYHTAVWPQHGVNLKNKRIAVVGTGASGIQVAQTIGPKAKHLTILQRTPNLCLPMNQGLLNEEEEQEKKRSGAYQAELDKTRDTFAGFTYTFTDKDTFDDTPEEREAFFEELFRLGGFRFWLQSYRDVFKNPEANRAHYDFWRKKVLERVKNPEKQKLLAPENPPHPWGTKRPSLEQNFYEVVDQDNVTIHDLNADPLEEADETGIKTKTGHIDLDVLILATGFDSVTGSLGQLNIQSPQGGTIADHWKDGLKTSMGIALPGWPNMFFLYGPQAPTAFSNGPSCTQFQAEFVEKVLKQATEQNITRLEATQEAEDEWTKRVRDIWADSLFPQAKSWYQGANIPGRIVEPLNWAGGMPAYVETLHKSLENDYQGWKVEKA